ncbi:uncharacterized protein LOC116212426 [Punica granatum]|uniref:Uncharacterized protein LOC116212426 n=1 Tax=Punica granatum TaxID=22663 RepID=A0A6P8EC91_PUNGR|nr:uncharacterized protein LOC116212426 [Punica granatum]
MDLQTWNILFPFPLLPAGDALCISKVLVQMPCTNGYYVRLCLLKQNQCMPEKSLIRWTKGCSGEAGGILLPVLGDELSTVYEALAALATNLKSKDVEGEHVLGKSQLRSNN